MKHLHDDLLILPNAWDALSARVVADAGAKAIATAGAAVAWTHGRRDGRVTLDEVVVVTASIARAVNVPVTVDLDDGLSDDPRAVADHVARVVEAGAAGVNLEDRAGDPSKHASRLAAVKDRLGDRVFVNARTCVVLFGGLAENEAAAEVARRAEIYERAGADGLFVPLLVNPDAIRAVAASTRLPLNVMLAPGLPQVSALRDLGVRRLSVGPRLAEVAYAAARTAARALLAGDATALLGAEITYAEANAWF